MECITASLGLVKAFTPKVIGLWARKVTWKLYEESLCEVEVVEGIITQGGVCVLELLSISKQSGTQELSNIGRDCNVTQCNTKEN